MSTTNAAPQTLRGLIATAREKALAEQNAGVAGAATTTTTTAAPATPPAGEAGKGAPVMRVYKADADRGVVYTFASAAVVDKDGELVPQDDLVKMAHDFCASKGRAFNANHGQQHFDLSKAELVESVIGAPILKSGRVLKLGEELPAADEDPVVGMNLEKGAETHWLIAVRPNDDAVLEEARKGGLIGASWEGFGRKELADA